MWRDGAPPAAALHLVSAVGRDGRCRVNPGKKKKKELILKKEELALVLFALNHSSVCSTLRPSSRPQRTPPPAEAPLT